MFKLAGWHLGDCLSKASTTSKSHKISNLKNKDAVVKFLKLLACLHHVAI